MRHFIGLSEYDMRVKRLETPVYYTPEQLLNAHMLVCGVSGAGKSYQLGGFLGTAVQYGTEVDVFDPHDEFGKIPGATACIYSQATNYGHNPLVLDVNPHTGGVNRQVEFFVRLIKEVTPGFGIKQEGALRNLLIDTYAAHGITQEDRSSWQKQSINEATRAALIEAGEEEKLKLCYPTMEDLKTYAYLKLVELAIGGDNRCVTAFEQLTRLRKRLDTLMKQQNRAVTDREIDEIIEKVDSQKDKCIDSYTEFVKAMQTGRELDSILKYDSSDVLTSVLQRITLLGATGILSANEPPFGAANVRVHMIKSISNEQQQIFVKLRLLDIFERCKRLGAIPPGSPPRHIVFIDEGHKYFTNDDGDIINVISKEARKFGLGLWCASQQPTAFPESFLTNVGATILLGLHSSYWKRAASMFRISDSQLKEIRPKEVMAVKLLKDGCVDPPFTLTIVPNPNTQMGNRAALYQARV